MVVLITLGVLQFAYSAMATRRAATTTTIVVRPMPPSPMSPASRQLLQRARQRQAWRSAFLLMGLLGVILATILSLTTTARIEDIRYVRASVSQHALVTQEMRRLQGSSKDDDRHNGKENTLVVVREPGLRGGTSTKNATILREDLLVSTHNNTATTTTVSNTTTTTTKEMSSLQFSQQS